MHKARRMEELGLKGKADVAQIEAQMAEDDYNLTHMKNMYDASVITLKDFMNYPVDQTLDVDTLLAESAPTYNTDEEMPAIYEASFKN